MTVIQAPKLLNYLQLERAKIIVFSMFLCIWRYVIRSLFSKLTLMNYSHNSYFRHWLNWVILYSVWFEFDLMPYVQPLQTLLGVKY